MSEKGADREDALPVGTKEMASELQTIELLEEALRITKRTVEHGRVRVSVLTDTEDRQVVETLKSRRVEVEHVPVGRQLGSGEALPQSRTENGVLIVPMFEERLVLEKRLVLTEELHIRVVHDQQEVRQFVPLRRQRAEVERIAPDGDPAA